MQMKLVAAASILALGLAGSAFAQSGTSNSGASTTERASETNNGTSGTMQQPMSTDTTTTGSTMNNGTKGNCGGGNEAAENSGKGTGALQTQGGMSNATPADEACSSQNN